MIHVWCMHLHGIMTVMTNAGNATGQLTRVMWFTILGLAKFKRHEDDLMVSGEGGTLCVPVWQDTLLAPFLNSQLAVRGWNIGSSSNEATPFSYYALKSCKKHPFCVFYVHICINSRLLHCIIFSELVLFKFVLIYTNLFWFHVGEKSL